MSTRRHIQLTAPAGGDADLVFAAVQAELRDGTIVGAEPCLYPERIELTDPNDPDNVIVATVTRQHRVIHATVLTDSDDLILRWVYEDHKRGTLLTDYQSAGAPRRPGPTVRT